MKQYYVPVLVLVLVAAVLLMRTTRARADNGDDGSGRLVGTWVINVTANPISLCNGPQIAPAPPPFVELATYAAGGTFTETNTELNFNSSGSALHLNGSDGLGAWQPEKGRFATSFRKLLFAPTGDYVGNADLHEQVSLDRLDHLSGPFTITVTFLNGSPSICSSGMISGERLKAE